MPRSCCCQYQSCTQKRPKHRCEWQKPWCSAFWIIMQSLRAVAVVAIILTLFLWEFATEVFPHGSRSNGESNNSNRQTNKQWSEREGRQCSPERERTVCLSPKEKRSALSSEPSGNQLTKSETNVRNKRQKAAEVHRSVLTVTKKGFLRLGSRQQ